jgi:hypothetical protein
MVTAAQAEPKKHFKIIFKTLLNILFLVIKALGVFSI